MKMSVYIPDDLWAQTEQDKDFRISPFVQQALRERFPDRDGRPYATLGDEQQRAAGAARERVVEQLTVAYRNGYDVGLGFAQQLPWRAFLDLAATGWNTAAWRASFDDEEYEIVNRSPDWAEDADYLSFDDVMSIIQDQNASSYVPEDRLLSGVLGEGFVDAIRDLWEGRIAGGVGVSAETDPDVPSVEGEGPDSAGEEPSDDDAR